MAFAKRPAPVDVPPVKTSAAVYSAPHFAFEGRKQIRGGVIEARHPKTGKLLWQVTVYQTRFDANREQDVQDNFIRTLSYDPAHRLLILSDERDRIFIVNTRTRKVTQID